MYDGAQLIGEYDASNALLRRYVPGPALDDAVAWYEGAGTGDRRFLLADERGSVVAHAGAGVTAYAYDAYGQPSAWGSLRLRYAGALMLPEAQAYHMRARAYAPGLGRFLQTDPILQQGGMNLYAYVGNDPMNFVDPWGLEAVCRGEDPNITCRDVRSDQWWLRLMIARQTTPGIEQPWEEFMRRSNDIPPLEVLDGLGLVLCPVLEGDLGAGIGVGGQVETPIGNLGLTLDEYSHHNRFGVNRHGFYFAQTESRGVSGSLGPLTGGYRYEGARGSLGQSYRGEQLRPQAGVEPQFGGSVLVPMFTAGARVGLEAPGPGGNCPNPGSAGD